MANLSNINNKFLFTDGDFLKIGNSAPINNMSGNESGISITNSNVASITLDNTAASGKRYVMYSDDSGKLNFFDVDANSGRLTINSAGNATFAGTIETTMLNTDVMNNKANTANIIYRTGTNTIVGNNADALVVQDGGNVGIGTDSPDAKLEVLADVAKGVLINRTFTTSSQTLANIRAYYALAITPFRSGTGGLYFTNYDADVPLIQSVNTSDVAQSLLLNPLGGNVGIGETLPDRKLHVNSGTDNANTIFESTDTAVTIRFKDSTGETELECRNDWRFSNNAGADERMRITSAGNVGIGTDSPSNTLHILGASDQQLKIDVASGGTFSTINFTEAGTTKAAIAYKHTTNQIQLPYTSNNFAYVTMMAGGTERVRITSSGNVGIGTGSSPSGKFHVKVGTSTPLIVASNSYCNNVGIRTTTPTASLQVKGNISYSYVNYTNVASTYINVFNMSGYPSGLYQISIIKKTNASTYISAIIKWDSTASASTAGTIVNTITSNQLGVSFNGTTTLQAISGISTGTLMSANLKCLVMNEDFCS